MSVCRHDFTAGRDVNTKQAKKGKMKGNNF